MRSHPSGTGKSSSPDTSNNRRPGSGRSWTLAAWPPHRPTSAWTRWRATAGRAPSRPPASSGTATSCSRGSRPEARRSLDDYRRLAGRLEDAGGRAREAGLQLAYHNHDFEFERLDGAVPFDILAGTDPDLVQFQLDLYWIRKAGGDALAYFRRHPGRFPSVHVKDMAADGAMVDVGAGVIDWPALFAHADTAVIRHYFVEHDQPADPLASIRNSFIHLRGLER
ncbi:MAG TPA: sugar phosphate isomerase/epimerase [Longimicrobiales bacterium]|nr:sugar phosphate isomerase/epimerase [Longimicrobiales bacterium]